MGAIKLYLRPAYRCSAPCEILAMSNQGMAYPQSFCRQRWVATVRAALLLRPAPSLSTLIATDGSFITN